MDNTLLVEECIMKTIKRRILSLFVIFFLIAVQFSVSANISSFEGEESFESIEEEFEQIEVTIHTLRGKEKIMVEVPVSDLDAETIPGYEDILSYLPEDKENEILQQIEQDKQTLSNRMQKRTPMLNIIESKLEHTAASTIFSDAEYYINYLCSVTGVGLLLLFPPFLPITPILWAGLLIINTNGSNGEINKAVEQAFMLPFIGISVWWVQAYVFSGFAGVAIMINNPDSI